MRNIATPEEHIVRDKTRGQSVFILKNLFALYYTDERAAHGNL